MSGLRNPACCKRRVPGGAAWTPASLTPTAWYRGDVGTVASWTDQSGNGLHATQTTVGNRPTLATGINAQATYHFNGTTQWFTLPSIPINGASTIVVVYKMSATPGASTFYTPIAFNDGISPTGSLIYLCNFSGYLPVSLASSWTSGNSVGFSPTFDTAAHALIAQYAGGGFAAPANYVLTYGGTSQTVAASGGFGAASSSYAAIGSDFSSGRSFFAGDIAEIILVNRSITGGEKTSLLSYLSTRYLV